MPFLQFCKSIFCWIQQSGWIYPRESRFVNSEIHLFLALQFRFRSAALMLFEPISNQSKNTHKINARHKAKHIKIRLYDEILMVYRQLKAQSLNTLQFLWCELIDPRVGSRSCRYSHFACTANSLQDTNTRTGFRSNQAY